MTTYNFVDVDGEGNQIVKPLTAEQMRDVMAQLLAQPPVQFDRLEDADGWRVSTVGHTSVIIRIRPEKLN